MDYNNIDLRIKRIYTSIDRMNRYGGEVLGGMKSTKEDMGDGKIMLSLTFGDETEALNQTHEIISNLANLKDIIKDRMEEQGKDSDLIETDINNSPNLQLVLDLSNQEKHGYPLKKTRRSGKDPLITNIRTALSPSSKPDNIRYSASDGSASLNMMISIKADVVDLNGQHICTLDELINQALNEWEAIILNHSLNS